MFQNDVLKQYKENNVYTTSPEELTLMLYNGLIKFLMKSETAIIEKNHCMAHNNLLRAQDIVNEFIASLNMDYEVSKSLILMYDYMVRRLIEANVKKDPAIVVEIMTYAKELRDTWQTAMKIAKTSPMYKDMKLAK